MTDIVIGQYYPIKSFVHSLDPRTKLLASIAMIVMIFLANTFIGLAISLVFILLVDFIAHIPLKKLLKGLKAIYFLLAFTFILNVFFYAGEDVILTWWILRLTSEGLRRAFFMAFRLLLLVTGAGLLTFTTSPIELTDGIEALLRPLAKIKFPVHEIAMMMSIALRFIPILTEETDKIMKAQTARGAVFDEGSIIKRARAIVALLIPLLVSAFRRAEELAMAMEARAYHGGEGRTRLKTLKYSRRDLAALFFVLAFALLIILDKILLGTLLPMLVG